MREIVGKSLVGARVSPQNLEHLFPQYVSWRFFLWAKAAGAWGWLLISIQKRGLQKEEVHNNSRICLQVVH